MIVRELADGRLLCIHQPTHAMMAEAFCRHWGNRDFARPSPYDAVMLAVGQHDNGWWEWEQQPRLRSDGYPMDFVHDDDPLGKVALWQRGVARAGAQHPYAGLLVARHAALLYQTFPGHGWDDNVQTAIQRFVEDTETLAEHVRFALQEVPEATEWLAPACIEANARLLQFGDIASLQVLMPWAKRREIHHCPVDFKGTETTLIMTHDETCIHFEPWPFDVDSFTVSIIGRIITQTHFASEVQYHAALLAAPFKQMIWRVER
ncbi:DUF3891 family protein [Caldilinea sp.]|jgi:hypothetical protein|uniref:DUF3891 family protein n=1 Tax=Caldilinea sp. TaxID=2293560 RepID=UPI001B0D799C|nr:DUF3891 family protein [Caldilinea sp.]MBO9391843.1 DUF3891 family protein [Caldilinea sp.]